jgi:hypothetical protein
MSMDDESSRSGAFSDDYDSLSEFELNVEKGISARPRPRPRPTPKPSKPYKRPNRVPHPPAPKQSNGRIGNLLRQGADLSTIIANLADLGINIYTAVG